MLLLILTTLVTVIGAGQMKIRDHSSDSDNDIEIHIIKWEVWPIDHSEPSTTTKPPSTRTTDPDHTEQLTTTKPPSTRTTDPDHTEPLKTRTPPTIRTTDPDHTKAFTTTKPPSTRIKDLSRRNYKLEKSKTITPEAITGRTTSTINGWITSHNHNERRKHIHILERKKRRATTPETTTERTTEGARTIATRKATTSKTTTSKAINEKTTSTTDGWISHLWNSYKVYRNAKNFDDAENRCRENGAHLVSIHSEQENQFVHNLTTTGHDVNSWEDFVYIGLRRNLQTGKWYWTDGSKVEYVKWAKNLPDQHAYEHCTQLFQDPAPSLKYAVEWRWNDIGCHKPMKYFVCKR
ncbi:hypothetical protein Y032_0005g2378 [Ancylostoma ceylanicum]|uniref:C-type lectin domain-containing protein n=2 Tax=Ancylostoma ceylanicum TaxID=53326 RepID=A0A016VTA8_9BILA|nr:hypothetical protein Y032_0005g2378 [Ancylostoma ceylanicum]